MTENISVLERILIMIIRTGSFSSGIFLTVMLATLPSVFDIDDNNLKIIEFIMNMSQVK